VIEKKAIIAIQDLIIQAKIMAGKQKSHEDLFNYLDNLEFLPTLILYKEDKGDEFEIKLEEICMKYDFPYILKKYKGLL